MPTIRVLAEPCVPLGPEATGADALARFQSEPNCLVLPVVDHGRPLGLIERDAFLVKAADAQTGAQLLASPAGGLVADEPLIVEADVQMAAISSGDSSQRPEDLRRGFIVTDKGYYLGVGCGLSLLMFASRQTRPQPRGLDLKAISQAVEEVRTPLGGIIAVADLLKRQPLNGDARAYVQTIVDAAESAQRIALNNLDLVRIRAGDLNLKPQITVLREVVDEVQQAWRAAAARDSITLIASYEGDTELAAEVDSARLQQVLNCLVAEALRYAREGVVECGLRASLTGKQVILRASVRHNGAMPGEGHPDSSGVSLSREIIAAMGSQLLVERHPGKGATVAFELELPAAKVEAQPAGNVAALAELELQSQPHILIVDDNATNRVVAQALCEMFGCTSECAEDGQEALEIVQLRGFDLILMDIKMPRMDGVQATQAIRALPGAVGRTPIIALTANADPDDAAHYLSVGMAAVVEKPIKPERLRQAMNAALQAPEVAQQPAARKAG
ncbi:response regulator [Brevundimonas sp. 2R-24]|uniref:histidine kinase n=1 Tax=Peiella sedimenti TaxID=3061083 RepID=A0ABT8SM66_9CAUL|nr:response regulator [Caulobacteraceae bacterium XZ-24]